MTYFLINGSQVSINFNKHIFLCYVSLNLSSLQPKMEDIPEGDWYCFECVSKVSFAL